jgi:ATP-binding cassette, subfamily B, bacterial
MKSNIIPMPPITIPPQRDGLLTPDDISISRADHGLLECRLTAEGQVYRGVSAVLLFPITHAERFVSLRYTDEMEKEREIGIIGSLAQFPEPAVALIRESLRKHYHEQRIERVLRIKNEFGQLFFTVRTQRGDESFVMPWRQDRAEDYGHSGKVLLDALNNRYLIPDMEALPDKDQRLLRTYVYW